MNHKDCSVCTLYVDVSSDRDCCLYCVISNCIYPGSTLQFI